MLNIGSPKRQTGESFSAYRKRRKDENDKIKQHLRGTFFWVSAPPTLYPNLFKGRTYVRAQR